MENKHIGNDITVIILTYNEELHIQRCIQSCLLITPKVIVIDSYSNDNTKNIALELGAIVYENKWLNYAKQFQWALDYCAIETEWIMRLDADEIITSELANEIVNHLYELNQVVTGIYLNRQVHFMGKWIKHGGFYPMLVLRIWRRGFGQIEDKWQDEHIKLLKGETVVFKNDIVDSNLNHIGWWTSKHNTYATKEAIDVLNQEFQFYNAGTINSEMNFSQQDKKKRWYKNNLYLKMPLLVRAFIYFIFRFFIKLGFLDGKLGLIYHFLQSFWYRFLCDVKIIEIKYLASKKNISIKQAIEEYSGYKIN